MTDHCDSRYPDDPRFQCVMHSHPDTINHYAHAYEGNRVTTFIWEGGAVTIDTQYPESPRNVRLVTSTGELPVDLVYLGHHDIPTRGWRHVWTHAQTISRPDVVTLTWDSCPEDAYVILRVEEA